VTADLVWLAALAAEVLGMGTDEALRAIDLEALDRVRGAVDASGADTIMQAATLMVEVVRSRPLPRHNRRLAVLGATWLLGTCRLELSLDGEALGKLLRAVEARDADTADVHTALFDNVVHQDQKGGPMFERFTDRARGVLVLAQEQATKLGHNFVGTEHLGLALLVEREGVGGRVLTDLGVTYEPFYAAVERDIGRGAVPGDNQPFTPRTKKVLELSLREALKLGHNYIGTEHMLLGLCTEGQGVAMQILRTDFGLTPTQVANEVIIVLSGRGKPTAVPSDPTARLLALYEKDVADLPRLSDDEDAALAEVIQAGITRAVDTDERVAAEHALTHLIDGHLRDVLFVVMQTPGTTDVLAKTQEGNLVLMAAAKEWRADEHGPFTPFVKARVEAALAPPTALSGRLRTPFRRAKPAPAFSCSFCNKSQQQVAKLIAGPGVFICDECVDLCADILADEVGTRAADTAGSAVCPACGRDLLVDAKVVDVTVGDTEMRLVTCGCGRVIGPA
jgi:hypothetical protein